MKLHLKSLALIVMILFTYQSYSQTSYKMHVNSTSIKLKGTSTLHDWEMSATHATGAAEFVYTSASETALISIKSLSFFIASKRFKKH